MSQKHINDVSHLFDNDHIKLGINSKQILNENFCATLTDNKKRLPTSRLELENLENWLKNMKDTQLPELDKIISTGIAPKPETIEKVEEIYMQALDETIRQVSIQSKVRGDLIKNIIDTLIYV